MKKALCALCLLLIAAHTPADPVEVSVRRDQNNVYHFHMSFVANAEPKRVLAIITDYNNLTRLNPLIKSSRVLDWELPNIDRAEIITEGCMLFFCKKVRRVEDVSIDKNLTISTVIVPALSDFKSGETRWTFDPAGEKTRVQYIASMQPDFWLPPFVGPYALKKKIHSQLQYTANKINLLLATHAH